MDPKIQTHLDGGPNRREAHKFDLTNFKKVKPLLVSLFAILSSRMALACKGLTSGHSALRSHLQGRGSIPRSPVVLLAWLLLCCGCLQGLWVFIDCLGAFPMDQEGALVTMVLRNRTQQPLTRGHGALRSHLDLLLPLAPSRALQQPIGPG